MTVAENHERNEPDGKSEREQRAEDHRRPSGGADPNGAEGVPEKNRGDKGRKKEEDANGRNRKTRLHPYRLHFEARSENSKSGFGAGRRRGTIARALFPRLS